MAQAHDSGDLILIRHAQSEWNALGRWQGHADPPLSPLGRIQAEVLADSFGFDRVDALYVSDLRRALETAIPLGKRLGLEPVVDAAFRELDVGRWSGLVREEIEASEPELLREFDSGDPGVRPGGGETRGELRHRAHERIASMAHEHPGERIVLVTHLGFIRALLPDAEPENASALRVSMHEALTARQPEHDTHPARAL
jgi:broad specificity phosphatase PhoE